MEKLLQLISKLREEIVPDQPLSTMSKEDVLRFIEDANIIKRMRAFHQKGAKGIRSAITEEDGRDTEMACRKTAQTLAGFSPCDPDHEEVYQVLS